MSHLCTCYFLFVVVCLSTQFNGILSTNQRVVHVRVPRAAIHPSAQQWPDRIVHYLFDGWGGPKNWSGKKKVRKAMKIWSSATCVQFKEMSKRTLRNNKHVHHLIIKNERNCSSEVIGKGSVRPGQNNQILYLSSDADCLHRGIILHELGHVLGLIHEHQRPNRDNHITINKGNMKQNEGPPHFDKFSEGHTLNSVYDKRSVMHYDNNFMAKSSGLKTILTNDGSLIGSLNWKDLTFFDAKVVNNQYQCASHCQWRSTCSSDESFLDKNCRCVTKASFREDRCIDEWQSSKCQHWKSQDLCEQRVEDMFVLCQQTCELCNTFPDQVKSNAPARNLESRCKDNQQYCAYWARNKECMRNPRYMNKECPKSCNKCNAIKATANPESLGEVIIWPFDECHDLDNTKDSCSEWKVAGFCETQQQAMSRKCPSTCGFCEVPISTAMTTTSPLPSEACMSDKTYTRLQWCEIRVFGGFCQTSKNFMIRHGCARECGWCSQNTVRQSVTASFTDECRDHVFWMEKRKSGVGESAMESRTKCMIWTTRGLCSKIMVQRLCPKSCGLCSRIVTTNMPAASDIIACGNTGFNEFCSINYYLGHCTDESKKANMMKKCARSCGFECRS